MKFIRVMKLLILVTGVIGLITLILNYSSTSKKELLVEKSELKINSTIKRRQFDVPVFDSNTWIFNSYIAQYSSKIIRNFDTNELVLEALAFIDTNIEDELHRVLKNLRLMIHSSLGSSPTYENLKIIQNQLISIDVKGLPRWFYRLGTSLDITTKKYNIEDIVFAIVDFELINAAEKNFTNNPDLKYLVSYQRPKIFNYSSKSVKKGMLCYLALTSRMAGNFLEKLDYYLKDEWKVRLINSFQIRTER